MKIRPTYVRLALVLAATALALPSLAGCGLIGGASKTASASDPTNLFHVKIPQDWQVSTDQGFLSIYAASELPAPNEKPKELSVLVFTSQEPSAASVPEMLDYLIDARAQQRGWKNVNRSAPAPVEVGGRSGQAVDVTATGSDGQTFDSRYLFVRTGDSEAFIAFIAPDGKPIMDYDGDIERMTTQWFWHNAEAPVSTESSVSTAAP